METLTTDQLTELRRRFDHYDSNADDRITSNEFQSLLVTLDQDLSPDEWLLAFQAADDDGDGMINFDEFIGWWTGD